MNLQSGETAAAGQPEQVQRTWPRKDDFPQTEAGWNQYLDVWAAQRRIAGRIGNIPMWAVHEHREMMALGQQRGWEEVEQG